MQGLTSEFTLPQIPQTCLPLPLLWTTTSPASLNSRGCSHSSLSVAMTGQVRAFGTVTSRSFRLGCPSPDRHVAGPPHSGLG